MQSVKMLSVPESARLCGVGRGTVNYWIREKKLHAERSGKKYLISERVLLHFLKSTGRNIPEGLNCGLALEPMFRALIHCWEFWKGAVHSKACETCVVSTNNLEDCFTVREDIALGCDTECHDCRFYREIYLPRINFIHQMDTPAAIYREFHVWAGNSEFSRLCGIEEKDLLGIGIEKIVHPLSLPEVISNIKRRSLGEPNVPRTYPVILNKGEHGSTRLIISVYPLKDPAGAHLILAEEDRV